MITGEVYVFMGEGSSFPSGVFSNIERAAQWIRKYSLSGIVSMYPMDTGVYDWAIENEFFKVKNEQQRQPEFIGKFSSATLEHHHFKNGVEV